MSIELKITGETPDAIAQSVVSMALMFAPKLRDAFVANAKPAEAVEAEPVADAAPKPRGRPRKAAPTIDHDEKEVKQDGVGTAQPERVGDDAPVADPETGMVVEEPAADAAPATGSGPAAAPEITIEDLRSFVISEWLNKQFAQQSERSDAFRKMLDHFNLVKLMDATPAQRAAIKTWVDAKIEKAAA